MTKHNIVWLDMEMTGLDPDKDRIIEIATIITDSQLNVLAEGPERVIHQPASCFESMDKWNQNHHTQSGLWQRVINSQVSVEEAEKETLEFIKSFTESKKNLLAGNSIWQDRRFIIKSMPKLDQHLHYRMIDVSTVKSLCQYWYPALKFNKKGSHRALDDIKESIEELRFLRKWAFTKVDPTSMGKCEENSTLFIKN